MPNYKIRVTVKQQDDDVVITRAVSAKNEAQAIAHVVKDSITCTKLDVAEAMKLAAQGIMLETAE